jgi:hypothetical protein
MAITAAPPKVPRVFRTLRRIRDHLAERLGEPDLSMKSVEWWAESGRIRTHRFGNQITARENELDEDLVQPHERGAG